MNNIDINNTIKQLYNDQDNGFKSIRNTFLDAKQIIPTINYQDVKTWFD